MSMKSIKNRLWIFLISIIPLMTILTSNTMAYQSSYSSGYESFMWAPLLIILFYIIMLCVWIAVAYWGYKDAKKRGQNGLLWGLIILFGGLIGIIAYLVVRNDFGKNNVPRRMCPACGRQIPFDANICPYCGKKFEKCF